MRKERFVDDMTDLAMTAGRQFREVTAINDTLVTTGPAGRVGRVSLTAAYAKGVCCGSISFHFDQGQWKLLGVGPLAAAGARGSRRPSASRRGRRVQGSGQSPLVRRARPRRDDRSRHCATAQRG